MIIADIKGLPGLKLGMAKATQLVLTGLRARMLRAGLLLQAYSMAQVPVQFGVLRASAFIRDASVSDKSIRIQVGYTAAYAVYVHENIEAAHGAWFNILHADAIAAGKMKARGEGQKAKFLEDPAREHLDEFRAVISTP